MHTAKKKMEEHTKVLKMGFVVDSVLQLAPDREEISNEYFLREFKGTEEYRRKLESESHWRKLQNGKHYVKINRRIFSGFLDSSPLAKIMLTMENIKVSKMELPGEILLVVPCQSAENVWCDVTKCNVKHKTAKDAALEIFPDGVIPEDKMFPVSHYLKKYVDILEDSHLKKIAKNYDLKLVFLRSGEVYLRGNLWIKDLEKCNMNGETPCQSDLSTIFKEEYQLSGGEEESEEEERLSPELEALLGPDERHCLRESSLLEAYFCNGRGLKLRWASQAIQKLDIRDEEMVT